MAVKYPNITDAYWVNRSEGILRVHVSYSADLDHCMNFRNGVPAESSLANGNDAYIKLAKFIQAHVPSANLPKG